MESQQWNLGEEQGEKADLRGHARAGERQHGSPEQQRQQRAGHYNCARSSGWGAGTPCALFPSCCAGL